MHSLLINLRFIDNCINAQSQSYIYSYHLITIVEIKSDGYIQEAYDCGDVVDH
jgi:hypothetical protein